MFKKRLEKKNKLRKQLKKYYDFGYAKAVKEKDEEIAKIKLRHQKELKFKNNKILKQKKYVRKIEDTMDDYADIFEDLNHVAESVSINSYIRTMTQEEEHQKVKKAQGSIQRLRRRFEKVDDKIDDNVVAFERVKNE